MSIMGARRRDTSFGKNNITWLIYFLQCSTNKDKYIGPFSDFVVRQTHVHYHLPSGSSTCSPWRSFLADHTFCQCPPLSDS
jgi:hypothetical protein